MLPIRIEFHYHVLYFRQSQNMSRPFFESSFLGVEICTDIYISLWQASAYGFLLCLHLRFANTVLVLIHVQFKPLFRPITIQP